MKLQQLGVIFIIIVVPIAMVLSEYTANNREVLKTQAQYDTILYNSTYDAVRAFQMNTINNGYSTINDSKIRDISASVNSFYNSLASGLGSSGYTLQDLQGYVPALLFTMYDGYYLYGDYQNMVELNDIDGDGTLDQVYSNENSSELTSINGIKPYIYYTCEYRDTNKFDIIVNYTLDNYITVMGTDKNGNIVNRSGYLINPSDVTKDASGNITAHGVQITPETLGEYAVVLDSLSGSTNLEPWNGGQSIYYQYVYFNNQKYYWDTNPQTNALSYNGINIFRLNNNLRNYLSENEANDLAKYVLNNSDATYSSLNQSNFIDRSAYRYYDDALSFSNYVINDLFSGVTVQVVTDTYNNQLNYTKTQNGVTTPIHARTTYDVNDVFRINNDNDPEVESSIFNEHRMDVIISSIESNLMSIIANFNIHQNSGYEFALPVLTEEDWYNITNNITVVSFMQGMPIGNFKYYSNYSVVINTKNKEFVSRDAILVRSRETGNRSSDLGGTYHNPRCVTVNNENSGDLMGYNNVDYEQQTVMYDINNVSTTETRTFYYYPHSGSGAYECVIGRNELNFTSDNLITGDPLEVLDPEGNVISTQNPGTNVRKAYVTALAREKYNLYKISDYFNFY